LGRLIYQASVGVTNKQFKVQSCCAGAGTAALIVNQLFKVQKSPRRRLRGSFDFQSVKMSSHNTSSKSRDFSVKYFSKNFIKNCSAGNQNCPAMRYINILKNTKYI
jgi:hypothetical protein